MCSLTLPKPDSLKALKGILEFRFHCFGRFAGKRNSQASRASSMKRIHACAVWPGNKIEGHEVRPQASDLRGASAKKKRISDLNCESKAHTES